MENIEGISLCDTLHIFLENNIILHKNCTLHVH